ncbi:MAG: hypothetical protein A2X13_04595 [Bacteroidetes bacterium GWC2_33_15]|nr:MAG: hypothetical protein A2X10_06440 [Bacteroidetes bacterium GWA2_33_15]OFX49809.1 MAG: hypothetical protein A2X13_04595 [Bacteroidetes bacterium GWC2_33_15]OFX65000.1 MAG: hypothetical protein A2X15_06515 [Bacteroidetes bacterium GWB2_32_14]OFX69038.1 MAG: hypothetical protein A2X14_13640 [Bacteroidetes bacterium GWD2_33_33]HAN18307.1 hypothetical protein [Bacteroidales bacterium]
MIATYIQELLATNNRVIIPNYGAFLVRTTSKSKDANTLEEKLNDVYFSPFLKFNDELLEKYIISKEGISKAEASEKIKKFIEEVKSQLDNENPYEIKSFGSFTSDKQGKVQFIPVVHDVVEKEQKQDKIPVEPKKTKEPKTKEAQKKTIKEPAKKSVEIIEEIKEPVKETIPVDEPVREIPKTEITQPVMTKTKPVIQYESKKSNSSINKGLVWSIAIGLPLAAIFIWALLNFNIVSKVLTKNSKEIGKTTKLESKKESKEKTIKEEPTTRGQQPKEEKVVEQKQSITATQQAVPGQKKYYIIAGSFKNDAYASSYLKKLQEQGYPAEKLAERNGMHAVSYSSFTDKQKALAEYKFLTQEKKVQTWILYY